MTKPLAGVGVLRERYESIKRTLILSSRLSLDRFFGASVISFFFKIKIEIQQESIENDPDFRSFFPLGWKLGLPSRIDREVEKIPRVPFFPPDTGRSNLHRRVPPTPCTNEIRGAGRASGCNLTRRHEGARVPFFFSFLFSLFLFP